MNLDFAMITYRSIRCLEELSETQKEQIVRVAYFSGDTELIDQYIADVVGGKKTDEELRKDYEKLTDEMPQWAEDMGKLILAMAMYGIEQEEVLKEVSDRLEAVVWQTKSPKPSR